MKPLTIEEKRARLITIRRIVSSLQFEAKNLRNDIADADTDAVVRGMRLVDELREQMEK